MHAKWTQLCTANIYQTFERVYATLQNLGHVCLGYIDDSYLQGDTFHECLGNVKATASLFNRVGFCLHPTKSIVIHTQQRIFLGFALNSIDMTVTPTNSKIQKIVTTCQYLLTKSNATISSCRSD